eukprot:643699-Rhodomonas_salina.2
MPQRFWKLSIAMLGSRTRPTTASDLARTMDATRRRRGAPPSSDQTCRKQRVDIVHAFVSFQSK